MSKLSLDVRDLRSSTTAILSVLKQICCRCQVCPHTAAATTIGSNSFAVMCMGCQCCGQMIWNQPWESENAPQPNAPDASDTTSVEGDMTGKNDFPFQPSKKACHHSKSALAHALRRTK